ncbi:MAG: V-type ATP synthase subunit F [Spirochaetia bacterium]
MKYFFIGDEESAIAFRMAGVETALSTTEQEALTALNTAIADETIAIILITETAAQLIQDVVNQYIFALDFPLICEIPGASGRLPDRMTLHEMANHAIGVKI